jgi:hypothetical protein
MVLLALWIYATAEGSGRGRYLARRCDEHDAYRWLRGGVPLNYHLLDDFRTAHQAEVDEVITELLATLMAAELVTLKRVAQDGMRVRASAGAASFRREAKLTTYLEQAREQVARLRAEQERPSGQTSRRQRAARQRAAAEREARVDEALRQLPRVRAVKKRAPAREQARASTTDPEARVMKMPDGGFRPAYNVQFVTDTASGVIVGATVTDQGTDAGAAAPMRAQVVERTGTAPPEYLADSVYATVADIQTLDQAHVTFYAPIRAPKGTTRARTDPRASDPPAVAAWRARMATAAAQQLYRDRASTAEWVNAQSRGRYGLTQFPIRGLPKVTAVVLLVVLTHNLLRWIALAS